jgi:hypothetical protein
VTRIYTFSGESDDPADGFMFVGADLEELRGWVVEATGTSDLGDTAVVQFADPTVTEFEAVDSHGNVVHISVDDL